MNKKINLFKFLKPILLFLCAIVVCVSPVLGIPFSFSDGAVTNGNYYFDDENTMFDISSPANVYLITTVSNVSILEPVSYAINTTTHPSYQILQKGSSDIKYAVVSTRGYLWFVDSSGIKIKNDRDTTLNPLANDSIYITTVSSISPATLYEYNDRMYFIDGTILKYIEQDYPYTVVNSYTGVPAAVKSFVLVDKNNTMNLIGVYLSTSHYISFIQNVSGSYANILDCNCVSTTQGIYLFSTSNYLYLNHSIPSVSGEKTYYLNNLSVLHTMYFINTNYGINGISLGWNTQTVLYNKQSGIYDTFSFLEANHDPRIVLASGFVDYVDSQVIVQSPSYYNNSIIPVDVSLRFVISEDNHTAYKDVLSWRVKLEDPEGIIVYDLDLPAIACTQIKPWWDIFNLLSSPYYCDGSGRVDISPIPNYWDNGTYMVYLTEEIPGSTATLSYDSYIILGTKKNSSISSTISTTGGGLNPSPEEASSKISENLINFMSMPAFWGLIIYVLVIFGAARWSQSAILPIMFVMANLEAIIGLFDPYSSYVLVMTWLIFAIWFVFVQRKMTS